MRTKYRYSYLKVYRPRFFLYSGKMKFGSNFFKKTSSLLSKTVSGARETIQSKSGDMFDATRKFTASFEKNFDRASAGSGQVAKKTTPKGSLSDRLKGRANNTEANAVALSAELAGNKSIGDSFKLESDENAGNIVDSVVDPGLLALASSIFEQKDTDMGISEAGTSEDKNIDKNIEILNETESHLESKIGVGKQGSKKIANRTELHLENVDEEDKDVPPATLSHIQNQKQNPTSTQTMQTSQNNQSKLQQNTTQPNMTPQNMHISTPIYADYASLTPIDPRVKKVMFEAMDLFPANPSSLYKKGVQAKKALEDARMSVASFFSSNKNEIIFTSGGTESNNLVFRGILKAYEENIKNLREKARSVPQTSSVQPAHPARPHFVISTIEHPSIIEIALELTNEGFDVSFIPVNQDGLIDPKDIKKALRPETVLISIIYANNEIGTVQPLKEIAREVRHFKKGLGRDNSGYPYIHTDACQAALYEDMRILSLNIDLVTIDGGKVYGPRGIGVLVKRRHVNISPLFLGGNQENGLRPGTENLPAIIGLKHALDLAHNEKEEQSARLFELRETLLEMLISKLEEKVPGMKVNGTLEERLPNNLNICFPGIDAEFLVLRLDVLGVELSSVTSCRASNEDSSSYVIEALGRADCAESSLRITLGRFTTALDIGNIAEKISEAVLEQAGK